MAFDSGVAPLPELGHDAVGDFDSGEWIEPDARFALTLFVAE
jgi:hypothetical protein